MQDKIRASINAQFDPHKGDLLAQVFGSNVDLCYLLGVLVSQIAKSHARVTGCRDLGDWWKVYGTRTKHVTHWMPLPEPPKEVSCRD